MLKYPLVQCSVVRPPPGAVASAFAVRNTAGMTMPVSWRTPNGPIWSKGRTVVSSKSDARGARVAGSRCGGRGAASAAGGLRAQAAVNACRASPAWAL